MTEPKEKGALLSKTCVSFLRKWVHFHIYQRRHEVQSKYLEKGILVEEPAITYLSIHLNMGLVSKNQRRFENDFLIGEPDVFNDRKVWDVKSSYSDETFPLSIPDLEEKNYDWQVKGYMDLLNLKEGAIAYVLMDMPEELIRKEARWKLGNEYTEQDYLKFEKQFQYDEFPPYLRIREYNVEHSQEKIEAVYKRVLQCREYIDSVILPEIEKNFHKFKQNEK